MASNTLNWTNNSTTLNADGTRVERTTQTRFNHVQAEPVVLAEGNTGGLDPTQPTGTYVDNTVTPGNNYAYRVTTYKGDETADVISDFKTIYNVESEIGYPGGSPEIAEQYNCSVAPVLHLDPSRLSRYHTNTLPASAQTNPLDGGVWPVYDIDYVNSQSVIGPSGMVRTLPADTVLSLIPTASFAPGMWRYGDNGVFIGSVGYGVNKIPHFQLSKSLACPDEATIFIVATSRHVPHTVSTYSMHQSYAFGSDASGNVPHEGIYYTSTSGYLTWTSPADRLVKVYAYRTVNTPEAFAGDGWKVQKFENGIVTHTSNSLNSQSYHQNLPESERGFGNHRGAFILHNTRAVRLPNANYVGNTGAGDYMVFDRALDASDMNTVFAYLGNKYNTPIDGTLSSSDLYDG